MAIGILKRRLIIASFLLIFSVQAGTAVISKSATWDETQYFGIGKYLLMNLKRDVPASILHPPLSYYISSIPFLFFDLNEGILKGEQINSDIKSIVGQDIFRGQILLSSPLNKDDRLLICSRFMIVFLSFLLGYFIYRFGCSLYGEKSGFLALLLFVFCPNMLAHAGLITPDMTLTVFSFISIYYLWLSLKRNVTGHYVLAGIFLGLALLSKFTALLLLPIEFILCAAFMIKEKNWKLKNMLVLLCCTAFIFFLGYGFDITPYIEGIRRQSAQAAIGQPSFLMGEYSMSGWWYYYIVTFLLKTPIPVIILLLSTLFLYFKNLKREAMRMDELFLLIPIVVIFCFFSIRHQFSIGLRYVLPVYPFIFVFIGRLLIYRIRLKYILYALIVWYIGASLYISPHYLSYFNEAIGGPGNGYKYLVDSNLDWGQDLKGLKKFMDENKIEKVHLSYFGTDSPQRYGIKYDWLPSFFLDNPEPQKIVNFPPKGLIAISATNLQGEHFSDKNIFRWLEKYEPIAKIGYSIFVYDIDG